MREMKKYSLKRNVWGNIWAHIGGKRVYEFGSDGFSARAWIAEQQEKEREELRKKHQAEIEEYKYL